MSSMMFILVSVAAILFIGISIAFFWGLKRLEVNSLRRKRAQEEAKKAQKTVGSGDNPV